MYITAPNCEDMKRQTKHSSYTIKAKNPSIQIFYDDIFITECTIPCSYISASEIITIKICIFLSSQDFQKYLSDVH